MVGWCGCLGDNPSKMTIVIGNDKSMRLDLGGETGCGVPSGRFSAGVGLGLRKKSCWLLLPEIKMELRFDGRGQLIINYGDVESGLKGGG